jgi:hypothetical protein
MADDPLPDDDLDAIRDGGERPEPCRHCGARPVLHDRDGIYHYYHERDCAFALVLAREFGQ